MMRVRSLVVQQLLPRLPGDGAAIGGWRSCLVACLFLFLLSISRYWIPYDLTLSVPETPESWHLAHNLRATGRFANPFATLDTGPSAHLAPAFPAFLAFITSVFGVDSRGAFAYQFTAALAMSLLLGLFPVVSQILGMGILPGVIAASIWLTGKLFLFPSWEATYTSLLIAIATGCFRWLLGSTAANLKVALLLGFSMGLLTLLTPTCIPVFLCWLIWLALSRKVCLFSAPAAALVLLPAVMVVPWMVRNYLVFDRIILVRDDLGEAVSTSNNDCAAFSLRMNLDGGCFQKVHPNASMTESEKVLAMGEARYNELRLREAGRWISGNPHRFIELSVQRFVAFWLPHESEHLTHELLRPGRRAERYCIYLMTFLSILGLLVIARRDIKSAATCAIWLCLYPVIYYVVQFEDRYRYPIMWITFLLGAVPLGIVIEWCWNLRLGRYQGRCKIFRCLAKVT